MPILWPSVCQEVRYRPKNILCSSLLTDYRDLVVRHERTLHADVYPHGEPKEVRNDSTREPDDSTIAVPKSTSGDTGQHIRTNPNPSLPVVDETPYQQQWDKDQQSQTHPQLPTSGNPLDSAKEDHKAASDNVIDPSLSLLEPVGSAGQGWQYDAAQTKKNPEIDSLPHQANQPYHAAQTSLSGNSDVYPQSLELNDQIQEGLGHFNDVNFFELFPDDFLPMDLPSLPPVSDELGPSPVHNDFPESDLRARTEYYQSPGGHHSPSHDNSNSLNRLPKVVKEPRERLPLFKLDDNKRRMIMEDLASNMSNRQDHDQLLPTASLLQAFMNTYISSFHPHFPIFHLPTFKVNEAPNPLILSMCAIGALYRLERNTALILWEIAQQMSDFEAYPATPLERRPSTHSSPSDAIRPVCTPRQRPLWVVQSKLLQSFFGSFSGDPVIVRRTYESLGLQANEYRLRMLALIPKMRRKKEPTWHEWVRRETSKRLLYGMFILSSLISITYGMPPGLVLMQDAEIEMPDDESLWNAKTADEWQRAFDARKIFRKSSVNEALGRLMYGKDAEDCAPDTWEWSPFATLIVMHAVAIHMWSSTLR